VAKRRLPPIEGDRIILRLLELDDLPLTLSWRNQDEIRKWFLNTAIIPADGHFAWFERYRELDNDFVFLILAKDLNNAPVGQISLYDIDWDAKTAEFGRLMIGEPRAKGRGIAKKATRLLLDHCFGVMKLKEITLEVKENNEAAIAIYQSTGFSETARGNGLIMMSIRVEY
jgi:diamine N-acetyltransferase